jgi:hypothetical protein
MLYMVVAGQKTKDIASALKYHPNRVSTIINSPLFQAQLSQLKGSLHDMTLVDFMERIRQEVVKNFDFKVQIRDNENVVDAVRLQAAKEISSDVDRLYPKVEQRVEDKTIRIVLDERSLQSMVTAVAEASGKPSPIIDAEFDPLPLADMDELAQTLLEAEQAAAEED